MLEQDIPLQWPAVAAGLFNERQTMASASTRSIAPLLCALYLAIPASAATSVSTPTITVSHYSSTYPELFDMTLLSGTAASARIAMAGRPEWWQSLTMYFGGTPNSVMYDVEQLLQINVADGYRLSGISIEANVTGDLDGFADNMAEIRILAKDEPGYSDDADAYVYAQSVTSPQFLTGSGTLRRAGQFLLDVDYRLIVEGGPVGWPPEPSTVRIGMSDVILTLAVSPVPEPATYGMVLGGLGLLGVMARRRKP